MPDTLETLWQMTATKPKPFVCHWKPVQAHIQPVRDLADTVKVQGAQHSHGLKIKSASGAQSDTPVNGIRFHVSNAAGFGEAIAKEAEVGRHPAKMEGRGRHPRATAGLLSSRRHTGLVKA